jgi:hypothetical protein
MNIRLFGAQTIAQKSSGSKRLCFSRRAVDWGL